MQFLEGAALTRKIQSMFGSSDRADIAIAYWGSDALKLLKLKPGRINLRVVCCLRGGKSDPDIIAKFRKRAKQHDKLHAKVIWTPHAAIVGSANASSNGLPQEESIAMGLIEAGVYTEDQGILQEIQSWFQKLYSVKARNILVSDLEEARTARLLAPKAGGSSGRRSAKKSLLELARAVLASKIDEPVTFTIYRELASRSANKGAKSYLANNSKEVQRLLRIEQKDFKDLDWYVNWPNLPRNSFLIDCHLKDGKIQNPVVTQTFHSTKAVRVKTDEGYENIHFALDRGKSGFNFKLTREDAQVIRACSRQLWNKASGGNEGRCIDMRKAASILLASSRR